MFTSPYPVMALFYSCVKPQHQQNYGEQNGIVTHVENVSELVCCVIVSDDFEIALYPHSVSLAFKCLIMLNWTELTDLDVGFMWLFKVSSSFMPIKTYG